MKPPLLVDIETDGLSPHVGQLLLVGGCYIGGDVRVVEQPGGLPTEWVESLADPETVVISMTKFDPRYLRMQGWEVAGPFYDLQVMAWVLNENQPLNLDALAKRYCGITMDKRLRRSGGVVMFAPSEGPSLPLTELQPDHPAWPEFVAYCRRDVETEAELYQTLLERLTDTTWLDFFLEECVPFTEVLLDMEVAGLPVNLQDSEKLRERLEVEVVDLSARLLDEGDLPPTFNLNSGDQLAAYLYHPVAELVDSLELGEWAAGAVKECLEGDHEDCGPTVFRDCVQCSGEEGGCDDPDCPWRDAVDVHVADLLPVGFSLDKLGRTQAHGRWTFRGRGLTPTEKTPSGGRWATSTPVLKSNLVAAQDPWVQQLFTYRRYEKALTTYLRKYPLIAHEGRLYGRFNQTGTKTGRLSSSEPNLQNQPAHGELGAEMRGLFQGRLVVGDYSQLEPRLMAHFSEDPRLLSVYREDRDVYLDLAHGIFGEHVTKDDAERGIAKTLVLAMGYGAGANKVASILTVNGFPTDEPTAKAYLNELQRYYSQFFAWREHVITRVKQRGYVQTLSGRHRRLKAAFEDRRNWKNVGYGERQAVNAVVQGSAGDIVARVMVWGNWQHEQRLLAQVHDELVWEWTADYDPSDQQLAYIQEVGETAHSFKLNVPLKFEPHFGPSWYAAKEGTPIELPEDLTEATTGYEEDA